MVQALTIRRPDDWHLHLRDGAILRAVLPATAQVFARAIVMPNLKPAVTTTALAKRYRDRVLAALPFGSRFTPLMTIYLTDTTDADDLLLGHREGIVTAAKLYPAGATTNSESGVTDIRKLDRIFAAMEKAGIPLLIHGEVTDPDVDVFDRETVFIERTLKPLLNRHPTLKIVLEHVTTEEGAAFVRAAGQNVAATITAHHLMINRNAMFQGGIRPHMYCLPIAKREKHRVALVKAATSGDAKFFLGSDSAPHLKHLKEHECGCAGLYTAPVALECYAEVFDASGRLDQLERFASLNGPAFYGLAPNEERITLVREAASVAQRIEVAGEGELIPFRSGDALKWKLA